MSEKHSQLSIGTMISIMNPNTKRKIKVKIKKINTNGKIQVTRITNYGNGSGGKHNFLINRNQILVDDENNSGNVGTTPKKRIKTDDGNFNDIVELPRKGFSPFISTMSFPKNEVLIEKFKEIGQRWYGGVFNARLIKGWTVDSLIGKYRLTIPHNRMHIYGTFDDCSILEIYYKYILVDGYIREYFINLDIKTQGYTRVNNEKTGRSILIKKGDIKNKKENYLVTSIENMLPFLNQKKMKIQQIITDFFIFFKQVNISEPLLNNTIGLMKQVLHKNEDLKKLGCVFFRWKIIREYLSLCSLIEIELIRKIDIMLTVIQSIIFLSLCYVFITIYKKLISNSRYGVQHTSNEITENYEKLFNDTLLNEVKSIIEYKKYKQILSFIFSNYEKLIEPIPVPEICKEVFITNSMALFNSLLKK